MEFSCFTLAFFSPLFISLLLTFIHNSERGYREQCVALIDRDKLYGMPALPEPARSPPFLFDAYLPVLDPVYLFRHALTALFGFSFSCVVQALVC